MNTQKLKTELEARGLIAQTGGGELADILKEKRTMYVGVDPTADSMHMGNLVPIILMKHLSNAGHTPILLVGGATGMIGDPKESGERTLLDDKTLRKNISGITAQLENLLEIKSLKVVNNADWLKKVTLLSFLRDIGKHFTVNQLIKRDVVKRRLETEEDSISYTEFSYSLLQSYDYLYLNEQFGADVQLGGSDQWSNIISGVDLIRRTRGTATYALTTPIVTDKTTGKKFGKSEGNAVWLDAKKTSPLAFYQFWLNVADDNVADYLKIFSFTSLKKIDTILNNHTQEPHKRIAQKQLAGDVTTLVHGKEINQSVEKVTALLYGSKKITTLTAADKQLIINETQSLAQTKTQISKGLGIIDALVGLKLATSKSEARRLIAGNAVKVHQKAVPEDFTVTAKDYKDGLVLIKKGKSVGVLYTK
jgi:tyrosyl-tRNA synthetase